MDELIISPHAAVSLRRRDGRETVFQNRGTLDGAIKRQGKKVGSCTAFQAISSWSPGRVAVLSIVPAGSSITLDARRYVRVIRFGLKLLIAATTRLSRSRKIASMGNFMPNVCIPLHGLISNPSPSSRKFLPSR